MVTARIAGLSPGTSPPPVRIPIRPFLVLMRPLCRFLRVCKRKIDGSDWMCKRHRLDGTVFGVTNSRCNASPSSDRFFFAADVTIQPFNVREAMTRPHFLPLGYSSLLGQCLRLVSYATGALPHLRLRAFHGRSSLPSLCYRIAGNSIAAL